jgi:2-methylaconitate cis-trans-isomerase PrpF
MRASKQQRGDVILKHSEQTHFDVEKGHADVVLENKTVDVADALGNFCTMNQKV